MLVLGRPASKMELVLGRLDFHLTRDALLGRGVSLTWNVLLSRLGVLAVNAVRELRPW